jgi:hypothetical protein
MPPTEHHAARILFTVLVLLVAVGCGAGVYFLG